MDERGNDEGCSDESGQCDDILNRVYPEREHRLTAGILSGGGLGLALTTWVCFRFNVGLTVASLVYLTEIMLLSLLDSFVSSAILSFVAVGLLDFFFTLPLSECIVPIVCSGLAFTATLAAGPRDPASGNLA